MGLESGTRVNGRHHIGLTTIEGSGEIPIRGGHACRYLCGAAKGTLALTRNLDYHCGQEHYRQTCFFWRVLWYLRCLESRDSNHRSPVILNR